MDQDRDSCSRCLSWWSENKKWIIITVTGLTCLLLLSLCDVNLPKCSIQYFYIPALNRTLNSRDNTTLNFMICFDNPNLDRVIYYDDVHLTFSTTNTSKTTSSALLFVANYTVPKFYQWYWATTKNWGQVVPLNNQTVLGAVLPNGSAVFRLDLKTQVRIFTRYVWKKYRVEVGADIEVNEDGVKANKKAIELKKSESFY